MITHANRGKAFEELITMANARYRHKGIAIIEKQYPEMLPIRNACGKIVSCKVGQKSSVDYIGRVGTLPIAIEAKETRDKSISFNAVEDHQAAFLKDFIKPHGGLAYVLVSFNFERFYAVPAEFWIAARYAWTKRDGKTQVLSVADWITPGKASIKPEEMKPEWEIKTGGEYVFNYLKINEG